VLRYVAHKLRDGCREYDYVARMGGDEFVLLLPGVTKETAEARIAELQQSISEAKDLLHGPCNLSMSVGAAFFPLDSTDPEELLSSADLRMYKRKRKQHPVPATEEIPVAPLPLADMAVLPLTYQ